MVDAETLNVTGTPNERVTHWSAQRRVRGRWELLDYPDAGGVRQKLWPLEDLSVEIFRERWGHGEFRCNWVTLDPENPQTEHRRQMQGNGPAFALDPEQPTNDARDLASVVASGAPIDPLAFAMRLVETTDRRAQDQIERLARLAGLGGGSAAGSAGPPAGDDATGLLRAELAELRAEMRATEERRRLEDEHRRQLAEKEAEIARLRRELDDDRRDEAPPRFDPEIPIGQQLLAAAANLAMTNPAGLGALISVAEPLLKNFLPGGGGAPSSPPPAMPAPRPVPVAVAVAPRAPIATPIGQVFVPPPPPVAAAPVGSPIGQVFTMPAKEPEKEPAPVAEAVAELA